MKRFIFTMFALALGAGQTFAFDDVGEQQTVVTEQSDQYTDLSFETLEAAAVEVQKDTGQPQDAIYTSYIYLPDLKTERMQYTPSLHYEKRQEFIAQAKLPPNYRLAYS